MSKSRTILQGDVYICSLEQNAVGSEQMGNRPCVVVQTDALNMTSSNVIIIPITSRNKKNLPTHVQLFKTDYPYMKYASNVVLCENVRTVSKKRLEKCIGHISDADLDKILSALQCAFIRT